MGELTALFAFIGVVASLKYAFDYYDNYKQTEKNYEKLRFETEYKSNYPEYERLMSALKQDPHNKELKKQLDDLLRLLDPETYKDLP